MKKNFIVAIDGIAGAGKSTISSLVAKKLKVNKLNTGDIYRAATIKYLNLNKKFNCESDVKEFVKSLNIKVEYLKNGEQHTFLDNLDVTKNLHNFEVSNAVSKISPYKSLREYIIKIQREIASKGNIVVEGRDIGSHVLPNADYKIFLTASVDVRAKRQLEELINDGNNNITLEDLKASIIKRDYNDSHRQHGKLIICDDAKVIDTSNLTINQVVNQILKFIKES